MFIQFKLISFYKISTLENSFFGNINSKSKKKNLKSLNITIYLFFFLRNNPLNYSQNWQNAYSIVFFALPPRKKTVIFLRAPYKNKLARLCILRLKYTSIFSIRKKENQIKNSVKSLTTISELSILLNSFSLYNFSTHRLKHSKTRVYLTFCMPKNFLFTKFSNFN